MSDLGPLPPETAADNLAAGGSEGGAPAPEGGAPPAAEGAPPAEGAAAAHASEPGGAGSKAKAAVAKAREAVAHKLAAFKGLGMNLGTGVRGKAKGLAQVLIALPLGLFRGDLSSRVLTMGLFAALALLGITTLQLYHRFGPHVKLHSVAGEGASRFFEAEKRLAVMAQNVVFLERFNGTLEAAAGDGANSFEIELYIEADSPETASLLRSHMLQAREVVAAAIQGKKYDELLTEPGKESLKREIQEAVNRVVRRWSESGSVKQVFFTRFVMG